MKCLLQAMIMALKYTASDVAPAAGENPVPAEKPQGFAIVRDPTLGKALVTLHMPPKDAAGRAGVDVFEEFLRCVRDGEVEKAKRLCRFSVHTRKSSGRGGDVSRSTLPREKEYAEKALAEIQASEDLFSKFVADLRKAKKVTLGATIKQKSVYWTLRVKAEGVDPQPWREPVDLSFENNVWLIELYDLRYLYPPAEAK